ncbi:uncharacterized protein PV09_07975 [Verruconis gallopava]|uniref:Hemerythrin-like domain-containing protein n=1 Tax=Verruconis gallopava TaxID=253628 RepID=A0A0D2A299_9PEZI|nr:uncharacterized protein PV09_07975 [Verruconis gallopava]KIW00450.1 hypothetical protein PV09_07975 [Verruconis gallopava]
MHARSAVLRRFLAAQNNAKFSIPRPLQRRYQSTKVAMSDAEINSAVSSECPDALGQEAKSAESRSSEKGTKPEKEAEEKLPNLSPQDFRTFNRMAETMNYYHNHFRRTWTMMYDACEANKRPAGMSIRQFLNAGMQFCHQLTMHHDIEEAHIFPVLAKKMPAFRHEQEMKTAHKSIHAGLEKLEPWLEECLDGSRELNLKELKAIMDSFGDVLWEHLDAEVEQLGAENMRKFWTKTEMLRMPM